MVALREDFAVSNGSACTSSHYVPSHVLLAMGIDEGQIESAVRISWGPGIEEIPSGRFVRAVLNSKPSRPIPLGIAALASFLEFVFQLLFIGR